MNKTTKRIIHSFYWFVPILPMGLEAMGTLSCQPLTSSTTLAPFPLKLR